MSKLIIVCNEEHADKIVPSNFELDFAKKIPVYGKLYKQNKFWHEKFDLFDFLACPIILKTCMKSEDSNLPMN
jgi:hypothetical protein